MKNNEYTDLMKRIKCTDEFTKSMQEKLSSEPLGIENYEESVSGTDIAPRRSWIRYAAMAAAFVLVCGSIGGAAFALRQHDKNQPSHGVTASTGTAAVTELTEVSDTTEVTTGVTTEVTTGATSAQIMEAVPSSTILALLPETDENMRVRYKAGPTIVPQGKLLYSTSIRNCNVNEYDDFRNELASIEWTTCSEEEVMQKVTFEKNNLTISTGSYGIFNSDFYACDIYAQGFINKNGTYYKLLNEEDTTLFSSIVTKHFIYDEGAKLADKLSNSLPINLTADYTFYTPYEESHGKIVFGDNYTMYMTGEGSMNGGEKSIEMIMKPNGGNYDPWQGAPTALRVSDSAGNHESSLVYRYSNGILEYQPSFHYVYLLKDIERDIAGDLRGAYKDLEFTSYDNEDGTTTYYIKRAELLYENDDSSKEGSITELTVVTDKNDHLISYERKLNGSLTCSFKLENYKFDTEDFTMDNYSGLYDEIAKEAETDMNR